VRWRGANDLLIAARAVALDRTLVTDNEREFRGIRGIATVNWLR
jgi:tRNA(fMet)-specific endonuclease VapC